jgi:hypothetical protein
VRQRLGKGFQRMLRACKCSPRRLAPFSTGAPAAREGLSTDAESMQVLTTAPCSLFHRCASGSGRAFNGACPRCRSSIPPSPHARS